MSKANFCQRAFQPFPLRHRYKTKIAVKLKMTNTKNDKAGHITIKQRFPALAGKPVYLYIGESIFAVFSVKYLKGRENRPFSAEKLWFAISSREYLIAKYLFRD